MAKLTLAVNPGSSSREYSVFAGKRLLLRGYYENINSEPVLTIWTGADHEPSSEPIVKKMNCPLEHFIATCSNDYSIDVKSITGVGIRMVAPGRAFLVHRILCQELLTHIQHTASKAPLHLGIALAEAEDTQRLLPHATVCAISDSAFHGSLSHQARNYAIPRQDAHDLDIYRFGYHGISVSSVVHTIEQSSDTQKTAPKMIVCHLGSGSSITAIDDWKSIDTSMGYSPLEGLIMATRSGDIDVGAALELKKHKNLDDAGLRDYLNKQSGLLGLSESSNDIRQLLALEESGNHEAQLALSSMIYRIQKYIGAYFAILGGLDTLVFTATVGERSSIIRERICSALGHIGLNLDDTLNNQSIDKPTTINRVDSVCKIMVIPTQEAAEIARHVQILTS